MRCLVCGGEYKNLGVHVQKKHMPCDDYRRQFDIPLSAPLADKDLCELLSVSALQRLEDPEWLAECKKRCDENKGKRRTVELPAVSKKHLIDMNKETGESYRSKMVPALRDDYMAGMTPKAIQRKHGVAPATLKGWERMGLLPTRRLRYAFEEHNIVLAANDQI